MPKKAVGTNPLFSLTGVSKSMPEKTDNQNTKKVKQVSSDSTKVTAGKIDLKKSILKK